MLEGYVGKKKSTFEKLIITVLDETKDVYGVTTRVVEEREWKNGELYEVSRNFYAIDSETNDHACDGADYSRQHSPSETCA